VLDDSALLGLVEGLFFLVVHRRGRIVFMNFVVGLVLFRLRNLPLGCSVLNLLQLHGIVRSRRLHALEDGFFSLASALMLLGVVAQDLRLLCLGGVVSAHARYLLGLLLQLLEDVRVLGFRNEELALLEAAQLHVVDGAWHELLLLLKHRDVVAGLAGVLRNRKHRRLVEVGIVLYVLVPVDAPLVVRFL